MIQSQHHYQRYQRFIDALKGQSVDGYAEVHHIVPRSLGGSDDAGNLIRLTARQHYVAHWMLARAIGGSASRSFFMMSNLGKYGRVNSATYEIARKEYGEKVKEQMALRPNVPAFTPEHREKLRQAKLGRKLSEETKQKIADANRKRKTSDETKRKISEAKRGIATRGTGWKHSEETKKKMAEAQYSKNLKWVAEGNEPEPADEPESP
jgi:hypothetical protein